MVALSRPVLRTGLDRGRLRAGESAAVFLSTTLHAALLDGVLFESGRERRDRSVPRCAGAGSSSILRIRSLVAAMGMAGLAMA